MYTLTIVEENENTNYYPSVNKKFTFVEVDNTYISSIENLLKFVKNYKKCNILKIEKDKKLKNCMSLFEFISPEDMFTTIFKNKKNTISNSLLNHFVENWKKMYKNNISKMFYINTIKSLI